MNVPGRTMEPSVLVSGCSTVTSKAAFEFHSISVCIVGSVLSSAEQDQVDKLCRLWRHICVSPLAIKLVGHCTLVSASTLRETETTAPSLNFGWSDGISMIPGAMVSDVCIHAVEQKRLFRV